MLLKELNFSKIQGLFHRIFAKSFGHYGITHTLKPMSKYLLDLVRNINGTNLVQKYKKRVKDIYKRSQSKEGKIKVHT